VVKVSTGVQAGNSFPLGATVYPNGVNFCVFSKRAIFMELLLFDDADAPKPSRIIQLNPDVNRTFYYWHVFVPGLKSGQIYGYRVYGPYSPFEGHRFDGWKVLLDPYTRAVAFPRNFDREAAIRGGDNCPYAMRSVVVDPSEYDWEGDRPLHTPLSKTLIYELHVKGFTQHPSSGVTPAKRGTYAGLIEKIPYLKSLGITAVELLPVQQHDEQDAPEGLTNYWGYSPVAFFAPHQSYSSDTDPLGPVNEFRDMVKAFHKAGIEVILDVVFNHTAEGDEHGPTFCFRGFENRAYYMLDSTMAGYANYTGCGNTVNGYHSIVRRMLSDCLDYWVTEMHVDGFRFDLASVLARDEMGRPLESPPLLWSIESDPVLAGSKLIAEAWDAAGLYQVGTFVGHKWAEWNGQFRDDVRRFVRMDNQTVPRLAARIAGSPDLYGEPDREPSRSINFVTSHDGFTLNDLVTYNHKHNHLNREGNRDGTDANYSCNWGVEGPTDDPQVEALRYRQIKNFFTILLLSQGTPMLLMGDEVRRTQQGNNNAYCQDNELSWFDWSLVEKNKDLLRFVKGLIQFNKQNSIFHEGRFWTEVAEQEKPRIAWHGVRLNQPDWADHSHSLAFTLGGPDSDLYLYAALNAYHEPLSFELPALLSSECWCLLVDTFLSPPNDFVPDKSVVPAEQDHYRVEPHSVVVLVAGKRPGEENDDEPGQ